MAVYSEHVFPDAETVTVCLCTDLLYSSTDASADWSFSAADASVYAAFVLIASLELSSLYCD